MKKGLCFILGVMLVLGAVAGVNAFISDKQNISDEIPEGYMAVFHGGSGEVTRSTYIYKIDNGHANRGFKYINTENHTEHWGSPNWIVKIVDEGEFEWTDGAFIVAEKHGAYSYVKEPGSEETYTIEEYQDRFIMN